VKVRVAATVVTVVVSLRDIFEKVDSIVELKVVGRCND
jgi:hypothetical protein